MEFPRVQDFILTIQQAVSEKPRLVRRADDLCRVIRREYPNVKIITSNGASKEKASKKARGVGRQPTAYKFTPREKKVNPTKQGIITLLTETLTTYGATDLNVSNAEREFLFTLDGTKYKVVLSCPRK